MRVWGRVSGRGRFEVSRLLLTFRIRALGCGDVGGICTVGLGVQLAASLGNGMNEVIRNMWYRMDGLEYFVIRI